MFEGMGVDCVSDGSNVVALRPVMSLHMGSGSFSCTGLEHRHFNHACLQRTPRFLTKVLVILFINLFSQFWEPYSQKEPINVCIKCVFCPLNIIYFKKWNISTVLINMVLYCMILNKTTWLSTV